MSVPWQKHRVTLFKPGKASEGYTLIDPYTTNEVWLIDMKGNYVHKWVMPTSPRNHSVLLPNGNLLYPTHEVPVRPESEMAFPRTNWGLGKALLEVDWEGNEVWRYEDTYQSHTFFRMENGNTMIPRIVRVSDEIAPKLKGGIPGTEDRGMIWTDGFHEVTPEGAIAWEWSMADHLDPEVHVSCPLAYRGDWTHMNSCVVLPDGNILTSFRNVSTICIIDKATGDIRWQWGPGEVAHQHDPTLLDSGNILLFDNGAHRQDGSRISYSRVIEVNPATNKIEWEYKADPLPSFYSALISSCQRMPNGNTLICEGLKGRVFEVTMEGEVVWEYRNPFYAPHPGQAAKVIKHPSVTWRYSNALFRAYRYMPEFPGFKGKDLNPGKLDWINRLYGPEAFGS